MVAGGAGSRAVGCCRGGATDGEVCGEGALFVGCESEGGRERASCSNEELVSWVLSVRPGKVFSVAEMFDRGMFEHMRRTAADMLVSGRMPVRRGVQAGPAAAVLKWDLRSVAGRVYFTEFLASLPKYPDGIGIPAPQTAARHLVLQRDTDHTRSSQWVVSFTRPELRTPTWEGWRLSASYRPSRTSH